MPEPPEEPVCGDLVVEEPQEECDCGYDYLQCQVFVNLTKKKDAIYGFSLQDPCCYPAVISDYDRGLNASAKPCTRLNNQIQRTYF